MIFVLSESVTLRRGAEWKYFCFIRDYMRLSGIALRTGFLSIIFFFIARLLSQTAKWLTGIEIHPGATIGKGLLIDHGSGVVIGETAEIGDNCTIYQGVTLGGTGKDKGKRHPTLGDNVMVGSGAKILGPFKVGSNSKIAANAVVLEEIPENCTAVGVPARIVRRDGQKLCNDMDQVHIPDPVSQELCKLRQRIEHLENRLQEQQEEQNKA